ncbi:hypothetical protein DM47_1415 [Burkholderia mallei]|nr:hypothetical protein DO72_4154 [Burkholderia pseudomallei]KOT18237.1 hypothetical protein DM47_1415 [Burkholderia mallei]
MKRGVVIVARKAARVLVPVQQDARPQRQHGRNRNGHDGVRLLMDEHRLFTKKLIGSF